MMKRGYTLLFAVITAALVLGVAVFIISVSKKQYDLSISARDSIYALYAADSGIECAAFALEGGQLELDGTPIVECNNEFASGAFQNIGNPDDTIWNSDTVDEASDLYIPFEDGRCALITVTYGLNKDDVPVVRIVSRGYNQCDSSGPRPSARTVERAFRLTKTI